MFKVAKSPTFTHVVTVTMPVDGGFEEETLRVTYNYLGVDKVAVFDLGTSDGTKDFLRAVVNRLDDLVDEAGNVLLYNDEVRDRVFLMPNVRQALANGYLSAVTKAKAGN